MNKKGDNMPRFSEKEKEMIKNNILVKSKELFTNFGLKKTSIDEIVHACGIGKGTFYKFFDSKEELYLEVLEKEELFRDHYIKQMMDSKLPPKEAFKEFLTNCLSYIKDNPLIQRSLDSIEMEYLFRKLPKEKIEKHCRFIKSIKWCWFIGIKSCTVF